MQYEDEEEFGGISFARKYRPHTKEEYVGNRDVKDTINRYMRPGVKKPQTIGLFGSSGCGKTTMARLLIKDYRCECPTENGACGECISCQAFDEYIRYGKDDMITDVYEIDASEKSGKSAISSMLESMEYPAMGGYWKAYLIDEAHLLKEDAMGRLLKSIEEPPEGVLIILCTTNPEMLLDTVRNRCQLKLTITKPSTSELVGHLRNVCQLESKEYDLEGLRMLSARADNVVRDSLNYLETVLSTRGNAKAISVSEQFHQVNDKIIYDFYRAYFDDDYVGYMNVLYRIKTEYDLNQFLVALTNFTVRGIYVLNSVDVDGFTTEETKSILELFSKFDISDLSRALVELKRMSLGNTEANLMSFIYSKGVDYYGGKPLTAQRVAEEVKKSEFVSEQKFRNDNLERLQKAKLAEGMASAESQMGNASFSDIASLFTLEKVEN